VRLSAGLFAPIELLLTESASGHGATLTYVLPSSLIAIDPDATALKEAAELLDAKAAGLIDSIINNRRNCAEAHKRW